MIFAEPAEQAYKAGIHFFDISDYSRTIIFFKFKSGTLVLIGKRSAGVMFPGFFAVVKDKKRFVCGRNIFVGSKGGISTFRNSIRFRGVIKIKYRHKKTPFIISTRKKSEILQNLLCVKCIMDCWPAQ